MTSRPRSARARWLVVVPMSTSTTSPSSTSPAAASPTRSLGGLVVGRHHVERRLDRAQRSRATVDALEHPLGCQEARSRRTVAPLTPSSRRTSSETSVGTVGTQPLEDAVVATPGEHAATR